MVREGLVAKVLQQAKERRARLEKHLGLYYGFYSMHDVYNFDVNAIYTKGFWDILHDFKIALGVLSNIQSLQSQKQSRRKPAYIQARLIQINICEYPVICVIILYVHIYI